MRLRSLPASVAFLFLFALAASAGLWAAPRVRFDGISVGVGYTHYRFGPSYGDSPYWLDALYTPWHLQYPSPPADHPLGKVELRNLRKSADVYINGAYVGRGSQLREMMLDPGAYDLEIRQAGIARAYRVYVLTGKTIRLDVRRNQP